MPLHLSRLKTSFRKRYYRLRLPRDCWHLIPLLPHFAIAGGGREIRWHGQRVAAVRPVRELPRPSGSGGYVVATGPSVRDVDLSALAGEFLVGVNGAVALADEANVRFALHVIIDGHFVRHRFELVRRVLRSEVPCVFTAFVLAEICEREPELLAGAEVFLVESIDRPYDGPAVLPDRFEEWAAAQTDIVLHSEARHRNPKIGFRLGLERPLFDGGTVVHWAIQIAYGLGLRRIGILGMDLRGSLPRFYESEGNRAKCALDQCYDDQILPSFEVVRDVACRKGLEIVNLAPSSRLPASVLPKRSLAEQVGRPDSVGDAPCSDV